MFRQISPIARSSTRNRHTWSGARRSQSSFTFLNNQSLLQKEQLKQAKRKNKKSVCKLEDDERKTQHIHKKPDMESHSTRPKRYDYSWLPRVPSTTYLRPRDMSSKILYSGYRPLFLNPEELKMSQESVSGNGTKIYEFAMKLEELGEQSLWTTSATGQEIYPEWDYVPPEVQKNLKPFNPPAPYNVDGEAEQKALSKLKQKLYSQERDKLLNRSKGRKKPILSLLQLKKKLAQDD
ncbi:PET20 (YPL159C) [Zygosaccharomyces parabailii]|uniref:ZYBA0S09-03862g1_1 n=1 Tax=Zygosaccharomyces bailii (strain CLIB 213 / ATCC 58445 / CBS 680 / BCRC 21525 / NBRC 1098 / NCYC 1416 / NRRL Y-2227) TaxID=1333698 RepID=A0A8J2T9W9_ZYGB2|nr:PET20 (YPL159C) [Zygosaccharomyces parabailii]CDF91058.1 ZYBA0S09-03862g1_1 [Zygosaccharomyces bailii CLIB 213]CDH14082.1 related to Protein PET20, mitochondrial [Zygosaccharomyces bailii ISA1307]